MNIYLYFILIASLIINGCGRGDILIPIKNGYEYSDSGGLEKMILYKRDQSAREVVIDARVDSYKLDGDKLFVARRPRESFLGKDNALISRLSSTCEYWIIDIKTHKAKKSQTATEVRCN